MKCCFVLIKILLTCFFSLSSLAQYVSPAFDACLTAHTHNALLDQSAFMGCLLEKGNAGDFVRAAQDSYVTPGFAFDLAVQKQYMENLTDTPYNDHLKELIKVVTSNVALMREFQETAAHYENWGLVQFLMARGTLSLKTLNWVLFHKNSLLLQDLLGRGILKEKNQENLDFCREIVNSLCLPDAMKGQVLKEPACDGVIIAPKGYKDLPLASQQLDQTCKNDNLLVYFECVGKAEQAAALPLILYHLNLQKQYSLGESLFKALININNAPLLEALMRSEKYYKYAATDAFEAGHFNLFKLIVDVSPGDQLGNVFFYATLRKNHAAIKLLMDKGAFYCETMIDSLSQDVLHYLLERCPISSFQSMLAYNTNDMSITHTLLNKGVRNYSAITTLLAFTTGSNCNQKYLDALKHFIETHFEKPEFSIKETYCDPILNHNHVPDDLKTLARSRPACQA